MLDLPKATHLLPGMAIVLDDGTAIRIEAADEDCLEMQPGNPVLLARVAWHLGNRHTAVQVLDGGGIRILRDHVLKAMLEGLGAWPQEVRRPFIPEPGAYHSHD